MVRVTEITLDVFDSSFMFKDQAPDNVMKTLVASIERFTWSGNLTIAFNKPIIVPPIEVYNSENENDVVRNEDFIDGTNRLLQLDKKNSNDLKEDYENGVKSDKLTVKDVLTIEVDSAFLDNDDSGSATNLVQDYRLMRMTPT